MGNILICPKNNNAQNTCGVLIDLDYAKSTKTFTDPVPLLNHKQWDARTAKAYDLFPIVLELDGVNITQDAFYALWVEHGKTLDGVPTYVRRLCEVKKELVDVQRPVSSWCRVSVRDQCHL